MFFVLVVFPGLCLFSLIIGAIRCHRKMYQIDSSKEASGRKKGIIFLSVFCAFVFLLCLVLFLTIEPIEHPDYNSKNIFLMGVLTLVTMVVMFDLGTSIMNAPCMIMSFDSFIRFGCRWLIRLIIYILSILLACILLG